MTDPDLELKVADELAWDPRVDDEAINVSVYDGIVTLTGTVGSLRQRREAGRAAQRVRGVIAVVNELRVAVQHTHRRDDAALRDDVILALELDSHVPSTVTAEVSDGFVTLTGTANWDYQREEAAFVAGNVLGVTGVDNGIELVAAPPRDDLIEDSIRQALHRDARLATDDITVASAGGTATLSGTVRSWPDHDAALGAAWAAVGVTKVEDRLRVAY